jgi:hypothetical protein
MRNSQKKSQIGYSMSANIISILKELAIIAILGTFLTLIQFDFACSRDHLKCGDEVRIKTQDGNEFQGKLGLAQGDSLGLQWGDRKNPHRVQSIALSDVQTAYRLKRQTVTGLAVGALLGTVGGALVGGAIGSSQQSSGPMDFSGLEFFIGGVAGGFFLGTVFGGIIGYNSPTLDQVKLDVVPACNASSKDMFPVKLKLAANF